MIQLPSLLHRQRKEREQVGELAFKIEIMFWTGPFNPIG